MNKRGISGLLVSLIILLIVMTLIIFSTSSQFKIFDEKMSILSLNKNKINAEVIKNKCELACAEEDKETYCKTYNLVVTKEESYKGTCEELTDITSEFFSINKCYNINCA